MLSRCIRLLIDFMIRIRARSGQEIDLGKIVESLLLLENMAISLR